MATNAARAFDFTNSIGVNTHLSDIADPYGNTTQVKSELDYLGVHYVRDTTPYSWSVNYYAALASTGIKLDLVIALNPGQELGYGGLQAQLALIDQLEGLAPGSVIALEGQNEPQKYPDTYYGQLTNTWGTIALVQGATQAAVRADPLLSGLPLLNASVSPSNVAGTPADFTSIADDGNAHVYPYGGMQPGTFITGALAAQQSLVSGKPDWITEFGYSNTPGDSYYGVDTATQAKNTLNAVLDAAKAGFSKTFLYELLDESSNISANAAWSALGLFNEDGTPKPVATALHNLTTILADSGTSAAIFQPGSLDYSILGLPSTASQELFEKSDGTYDLVVWNEPTDWNGATQSEVPVAATPITVNSSQSWATASVFDPMVGSSAIASYSNVNSTQLNLTDHPLILQITPAKSQSFAAVAASVSNVASITPMTMQASATTNALVLDVSEDAWQGDAQYTVSVDGNQVGGVMTASASHANGQTQAVPITTLSPGQHTVGVSFLNDAYGGSPSMDRNLYVDSATLDGQTIAGSTLTMDWGETLGFNVAATSSLVLNMSEDYYQGDAQYTVAIDGQQVGGVMTASAIHNWGQTQAVSFNPVLSAGTHSVAVQFLNDAYGGSPSLDRNLYIDQATFNGATVRGATTALDWDSTYTFNVVVPSS